MGFSSAIFVHLICRKGKKKNMWKELNQENKQIKNKDTKLVVFFDPCNKIIQAQRITY